MLDPRLIGRLVVILGLVMLGTIALELLLGVVGALALVGIGVSQGGVSSAADFAPMAIIMLLGFVARLVAALPAGLLVLGGRSFATDPRSPLGIASLAMALMVPGCGAVVDFMTMGGCSCFVAPWWMLLWAAGLILGIMGLVVVADGSSFEPQSRDLPG